MSSSDEDESESSEWLDSREVDVSSEDVESSLSFDASSFALDRFLAFPGSFACLLQSFFFFFAAPESGGFRIRLRGRVVSRYRLNIFLRFRAS